MANTFDDFLMDSGTVLAWLQGKPGRLKHNIKGGARERQVADEKIAILFNYERMILRDRLLLAACKIPARFLLRFTLQLRTFVLSPRTVHQERLSAS